MIVEGTMIAPAVEDELEKWMLTRPFTYTRAVYHAQDLLKAHHTDFAIADRLADRMIQRLRKAGKINWKRVNGHATWSAVA